MNLKRIQQVLTWNIIGYKRDLINQALWLAALSFLFTFFHSFSGYMEGIADWEGIKDSAEINTIMMAILFLLYASGVLFTTKTRNEFANFMMLPATHAPIYIIFDLSILSLLFASLSISYLFNLFK